MSAPFCCTNSVDIKGVFVQASVAIMCDNGSSVPWKLMCFEKGL